MRLCFLTMSTFVRERVIGEAGNGRVDPRTEERLHQLPLKAPPFV